MTLFRTCQHFATLLALGLITGMAQAEPNEVEPVLATTDFASPSLLSGPGFQVDPHVEIRGYMAHFTLDTPIGPLQAESVEILADRVAELPALELLDQVTHSEAFVSAAGTSVEKTARGIGQVMLHPLDTLIGLPAGVARYFSNRLSKMGRQAQSLSDRAALQFGTEGDPYPRDSGPMTEAHSIDRAERLRANPGGGKTWIERSSAEVERELKRQIAYGQVKRELAEQLAIDPYTSNPYIRERLDALAWAAAGGRYAAKSAIAAIGGTGGSVLARGTQLNDLVWKLEPDRLRERNQQGLRTYCSDELLIRQFLGRGVFTPTLQTATVDALDELQPGSGCDALLELAMTVRTELEARFIVNALSLAARQLGERAHAGTLLTIGAGLAYDSVDGEKLLLLPVDYLVWTDEVSAFIDRAEFKHTRKSILIGGLASPRSERELTDRGWSIVTNLRHRNVNDALSASEQAHRY